MSIKYKTSLGKEALPPAPCTLTKSLTMFFYQ